MNTQPKTLEERIAVALQPDTAVKSAVVAALIEETEARIAETEKAHAVDPTLSRRATMDATLAANRLRPLLPQLQARYGQAHEQEQAAAWLAEQEAAWLAEYERLKRERDALAEELRELYPDAARKIVDIFVSIAVNNEALAELNRDRPAGVEQHLRSAELHARGLESFTYNAPSLLTSVYLFDWDGGGQAWPLPKASKVAAFAATAMPSYGRRFSGDWAKENERRAAGQEAERQRLADYYACQTQQQEERDNAEARERFAEGQRKRWGGS